MIVLAWVYVRKMKKYVFAFSIIALLLLSLGCATEKTIEKGDIVRVDYIGTLQDGTVFDTSILEEAQRAGIYEEGRNYQPLRLVIGDGSTIPGFEDGLLGMKEGETRAITIPPEQAYGPKNPDMIVALPRILDEVPKIEEMPIFEEIPRAFQVTVSSFVSRYGQQPTLGMVIDLADWPGQVIQVTGDNVIIEHKPEVGKSMDNETVAFTVTEIRENSIVLRYDVNVGDILPTEIGDLKVLEVTDQTMKVEAIPRSQIETIYGVVDVIDSGDTYILKLDSNVGDVITIEEQRGKVTEVTNDYFVVDFNHPLAGETLNFKVTAVLIDKGSEVGFFENYRLFIFGSVLILVFAGAYIFMTQFYSKEEKEKPQKKSKSKQPKEKMNGELKELATTTEEVEKELDDKKETTPKKSTSKKKSLKKKE